MLKRILLLLGLVFFITGCESNPETFTVEFVSNGGTIVESVEVHHGNSVSIPIVSKEGHTLDGWYLSLTEGATFDEKWSFSNNVVSSSITLYAIWIINQYTITFDSNGGTEIPSITQDYDTLITRPDDPTKEGYTFIGWDTEIPNTIPAGDLHFVAVWEENSKFEIAMITDAGDIDDKSFNQGTWEGIVEFAEANNLTHKYYKPTEVSDDAYVAAIDLAVAGGAKVIVTPGFLFEPAIYAAQSKYPDVIFVLIDGVPHPGDYTTFEVADNTRSVLFKENESGFLAGYASVMEGFRELGFMGGIAIPSVVRYGLGYVAGAYYAANELGASDWDFDAAYYEYLGGFAPTDDIKNKAASWYSAGVEVIHAAAGGAGNSVMAAAEEATDAFVVGVDVDQAAQSSTVISSAMKALAVVVQQALQGYLDGTFVGGETLTLGAAEDAVALPLGDSFRFTTFTIAQYYAILADIIDGTVVVPFTPAEFGDFLEGLGMNVALAATWESVVSGA